MRRILFAAFAAGLIAAAGSASVPARAADAICYNCPPQWADWGSMLKLIKTDLGYDVPLDNKNSGQALSQMIAEKANPIADFAYLGVTFGIQANNLGVTQPYKPKGFDEVPAGMKDPAGNWVSIHSGTFGLFINKDALGRTPVPACWKDLLKPEYRGEVAYLDPASAFVGYVGAVAINQALGGTLDNFSPAVDYFKSLLKNDPIVPKQTSYARVVSGEIPILMDYDFNAYRAKYTEKGNFAFVIPCEGTITVPYVVSLVRDAPHRQKAERIIDYLLSDKGQAFWANAYLRPVRAVPMPPDLRSRFLPETEYARAHTVDYGAMAAAQKRFTDRYLTEVR